MVFSQETDSEVTLIQTQQVFDAFEPSKSEFQQGYSLYSQPSQVTQPANHLLSVFFIAKGAILGLPDLMLISELDGELMLLEANP